MTFSLTIYYDSHLSGEEREIIFVMAFLEIMSLTLGVLCNMSRYENVNLVIFQRLIRDITLGAR